MKTGLVASVLGLGLVTFRASGRAQPPDPPDSASPVTRPATQPSPEPSSGLGLIIAGWISSGAGALNLAQLPVCYADFYPSEAGDLCVGLSIGIGIVGLGVGIPMLISGYSERATHKKWESQHAILNQLSHTGVAMWNGSALVTYGGTF